MPTRKEKAPTTRKRRPSMWKRRNEAQESKAYQALMNEADAIRLRFMNSRARVLDQLQRANVSLPVEAGWGGLRIDPIQREARFLADSMLECSELYTALVETSKKMAQFVESRTL